MQVVFTIDDLLHPQSTPDVLRRALRAVPRGRLKLAVLDYVISFPPVILPLHELTAMCKQVREHAHTHTHMCVSSGEADIAKQLHR